VGALAVLFVVNGWTVDHLLRQWVAPTRAAIWQRCLLFLVEGIPVLGISVFSLQALWGRRRESNAQPWGAIHRPTWRLVRLLDRAARFFQSIERLGTLFLSNCAVVFIAGSKFAFPAEPSAERAAVVGALCLTFHVLAWMNMTYWLGALTRRFLRHAPPAAACGFVPSIGRSRCRIWPPSVV
jgi:hypothetical protein